MSGGSLTELILGFSPSQRISKLAGMGGSGESAEAPVRPASETTPAAYSAHADFLEKQADAVEGIIATLKALSKEAGDTAPSIPRELAEYITEDNPLRAQANAAVRRVLQGR